MPKKRTKSAKDQLFAKVRKSTAVVTDSHPIYVFHVELLGDPEIWRHIEIPASSTLEALHFAIYDAYHREEEHLYAFYLQPPGTRRRDPRTDADVFIHPAAFDPGEERSWPSNEVKLEELQLRRRRKLYYKFDFGDSWWHVITLERTVPRVPRVKYPRVTGKHGKSPPQYPNWDED